jgi:hypothetical protein
LIEYAHVNTIQRRNVDFDYNKSEASHCRNKQSLQAFAYLNEGLVGARRHKDLSVLVIEGKAGKIRRESSWTKALEESPGRGNKVSGWRRGRISWRVTRRCRHSNGDSDGADSQGRQIPNRAPARSYENLISALVEPHNNGGAPRPPGAARGSLLPRRLSPPIWRACDFRL